MPDPILKLIVDNAETALRAVVTPAYPVQLTVVRPVQLAASAAPGLCALMIGDPVRKPLDQTPAGWIEWEQPLLVSVYVFLGEGNKTPFDVLFALYLASIEKALLVDVTRGGRAIDTIPEGSVIEEAGSGFAILQSHFTLDYRTLYGDPFSQ